MDTVLALDVGSSSVRAQRFDEGGEPVGELRHAAYRTTDADEFSGIVRSLLDGAEPDGTSCCETGREGSPTGRTDGVIGEPAGHWPLALLSVGRLDRARAGGA